MGSIPDREGPLEEGITTHSNILAWRIPQTGEPSEPNPQGHKELDTSEATEHAYLCVTELLYCTLETNTILLSNCAPTLKKKTNKKTTKDI